MDKILTGLEGQEFSEREFVVCPATGNAISPAICESGQGGGPCNYFSERTQMEAAPGKPPKRFILCAVPRPLAVQLLWEKEKLIQEVGHGLLAGRL